ncbi:MAG: hypothetical protein U5L08_15745 [Xanthomonadales bacterium]|nr:hypothetical protein [Xanthomonadales bacterium]
MPQQVSDFTSNKPENVLAFAQALGAEGSHKRQVFEAVYRGKMRIKTVQWIADHTGLERIQVLKAARPLASRHLFEQTKKDGDTAYEQIPTVQAHKKEILKLANNKKRQATYPTKRNPGVVSKTVIQKIAATADVRRVTVDDLNDFKKAHDLEPSADRLPKKLSEDEFRAGIQAILGEPGQFKDWGGENNDLYSGRLRVEGARRSVAFAFKGPGLNAKLLPRNMGKNGDQAQRLFDSPADVFIVEHWREIDEKVVDLCQRLAVARSLRDGKPVWYGIIDGKDAMGIYEAYPEHFTAES